MQVKKVIAGHFELGEFIAQGGMGAVYLGRDRQTGQSVAIKLLKSELVAHHPDVIQRFIREGEALRALNHPNIVKLLAASDEDGEYYLVMEYIGGGSLEDLLRQQPTLPISRVLAIALELTDALVRAHHLKVIHRDIKPANVLLAEDGTPRLTDFGVARTSGTRMTNTGVVMGTYAYMSPEAFSEIGLDARADLWAFGVMLYQMLAGRLPFNGDSVSALIGAILTNPPAALQAIRPDAPPALVKLIYRMLEKDRERRISSARLVGAELEGIILNWPGEAQSEPMFSVSPAPDSHLPTIWSVPQVAPRARHNLPAQSTPFFGRSEEMTQTLAFLADATCRLVSLVGPGGIGKTRLALRVATELLEDFADGVYFVPLASVNSADQIIPSIVESLKIPVDGTADLKIQLHDFLKNKTILLVIDNFEHLIERAEILAEILAIDLQVKFLVTSRERLNLVEESVLEIEGLSYPHGEQVLDLESYSAVQLFLRNARRANAGFVLQEQDRAAVVRICQLVDGIPLGIELAAAWSRMYSCTQIAQEIERNLDFLTSTLRNLPDRHRSIRAAFEHSWNLLTQAEKQAFERLSIFRGGFRKNAADAVTGASVFTLSALVDKSLLRVDGLGRYEIHEVLRQYAFEKLLASSSLEQICKNHLAYYTQLAEEAEPHLRSPEQAVYKKQLESDHDNLRTALAWCLEGQGDVEVGLRLASSLWLFWRISDHQRQGLDYLERLLARPIAQSAEARALALAVAGYLATYQGNLVRAKSLCENSFALARSRPELIYKRASAFALNVLGTVARSEGEFVTASGRYNKALPLSREVGDRWLVALSTGNLGIMAFYQEDYEHARALLEESLTLYREIGSYGDIAVLLHILVRLARRQGDYRRATALCRTSFDLSWERNDKTSLIIGFSGLAGLCGAMGQGQQAARLFGAEEALREKFNTGMVPAIRADHEQTVTAVRSHLDDAVFIAEWAMGRAMGLDQAVAFARESLVELTTRFDQETHSPSVSKAGRSHQLPDSLTDREFEVLQLLGTGMSNQAIADRLVVTDGTIKRHTHQIFAKLGVRNRTQAILRAKELHLL